MARTAYVAAVAHTPRENPARPYHWRVGPVVELRATVPGPDAEAASEEPPEAPEPRTVKATPEAGAVDPKPAWHIVKGNGKPGKRSYATLEAAEAASVKAQQQKPPGRIKVAGAGVTVQAQPAPFASGREATSRRAWGRAVKALERAGKLRKRK